MFGVPDGYKDKRLKNKDEVLILRFGTKAKDQVAIATQLLHKHPVYHLEKDGTKLVVLTDKSGASRAYESSQVKFKSWDQGRVAVSEDGQKWNVSEDELNNGEGQRLLRFASHNAFWFGWRAVFHETNLLK